MNTNTQKNMHIISIWFFSHLVEIKDLDAPKTSMKNMFDYL